MTTAAIVEEPVSAARHDLRPVEMGAWTLEYLGPGLRVQVRVNHRGPRADLFGWISPAVAARVFLIPMSRGGAPVEATLSPSGRFEFVHLPGGGGHRLAFMTESAERPFMTPPFWV
jgi:hypothetical protein